ncbi:hypothetical protein MNBD_BACTEROID05-1154 [hydrothermal vent metagenome]|uniref:CBS domain-containing protein n=1 Tax=hydrothermal vent metagenome TaxID=652676 RepID=A0A3B0TNE5_9ZZZZ
MISVGSVMSRNVVTIAPNSPIYEALELLKKHEVSGLPVVNNQNEIVGILSEKDVLSILINDKLDVKDTVSDYMSRDVISFHENDNAIDVCKFFINSHIRRVPIVNEGELVGVVSRRDIVLLIMEARSKMSTFRYV